MTEREHAHRTGVALVEAYLAATGRGDLTCASIYLAPGARLVFPGGRVFHDLGALAAASTGRYRRIDKHRDRYEGIVHEDGSTTVLSLGRLFGENLHGVAFDGVRYVDIFQIRNELIEEQLVYNDLAETGVLQARSVEDLPTGFRSPSSAQ